METLLLSKNDVQAILTMDNVIAAVKDGYLAFQQGKIRQPDIVSMEMPEYNGETDIKSCCNLLNKYVSVKIASGFYDNGKINDLPTMIGTIQILDATTGAVLCIMDGSLITGIRTAAAGAVSAEYLARKDSETVCVIGSGTQARLQIYALSHVLPIKQVRVYSRNTSALLKYKEDVETELPVSVTVCDTVEIALQIADVIVTTTPSKNFLVPAEFIRKGTHIIAVGADMAGKNELEPSIFCNAKIVNDSIAQCISRGETRNAVISGYIKESDIYGEIGELIAEKKPGRTNNDEITIFDTTGMAVQDNVTAAMVYQAAVNRNLGRWFSF